MYRKAFLALTLLSVSSAQAIPQESQTCVSCHPRATGTNTHDVSRHEAAVFDCRTCHDDHNKTPEGNSLRSDVNSLCYSCHQSASIEQGCFNSQNCGHPVSQHPVSRAIDPLYPQKKFNCVSCHDPHSASMPKLFRYDYSPSNSPYEGNLCATCHWKNYTSKPTPPAPIWRKQRI